MEASSEEVKAEGNSPKVNVKKGKMGKQGYFDILRKAIKVIMLGRLFRQGFRIVLNHTTTFRELSSE
jgi:hypothetical protein